MPVKKTGHQLMALVKSLRKESTRKLTAKSVKYREYKRRSYIAHRSARLLQAKAHYRDNWVKYKRLRTESAKRVARLLRRLKRLPCKDCRVKFPYYLMDFDHVRGKKKFVVAKMTSQRWNTVLAEVAKCDVVCVMCHRKRTHRRWLKLIRGVK